MTSQPQRLAVIGECMLEFCPYEGDLFRLGYAGDVYNMAVYFAHSASDATTVDFISAVGDDGYSRRMLKTVENYHVQTQQVRIINQRMPGLYMVENDEAGERDFHYYRSEAAARYMFDGEAGSVLLDKLFDYDYVYFSGITLAILERESREKFLAKLIALKQHGVVICFDSNYRCKLWASQEEAQTCYSLVMPFIDIALPSLTDVNEIYGKGTIDDCVDHFLNAGARQVVVTEGDRGYTYATADMRQHFDVERVRAVDTTGAGDSFNGAFLAALLEGEDPLQACEKAASLARDVVQQRGAIIF